MEQVPRKTQIFAASLLALTLGLPSTVHPELVEGYALHRQALRAESASQAASLEQLDRVLRSLPAAGAEEVSELTRKLKDPAGSFEDLARVATHLADLGSPEGVDALKTVLGDERMPSKNRAAAAIGLGLHGDPENMEPLLMGMISVGSAAQSKKAFSTIIQAVTWLNYDRFGDLDFINGLLESAQREIRVDLSAARKAVIVHVARLVYQEVLAGRQPPAGILASLPQTLGGSIVLDQLSSQPSQRKPWAAARLADIKSPFAIPALQAALERVLEEDPAGHDLGALELQMAASAALAQLVASDAGPVGKGPLVRRLKQEAIAFSRRRLVPERIQNALLKQAVEMQWRPIWNTPSLAAGAEEARRIDAEAFFGEYQPALTELPMLRKEEIFRWMDYDGFEIREVSLPDWLTFYVRGKDLMDELPAAGMNPEGISFRWKLLPLKPDEGWEKRGLILNDLGRHGPYDLDNPNGLRVRDVNVGETAQLNTALLLADALATLPKGSVLLGAELLPDRQGKLRLILFSA